MRRHHHYRLTKRRFFKNKYKKKYVGCLLGVNCGLAEELLHEPNQVTKDAIEEARIEMTHDKGATMTIFELRQRRDVQLANTESNVGIIPAAESSMLEILAGVIDPDDLRVGIKEVIELSK